MFGIQKLRDFVSGTEGSVALQFGLVAMALMGAVGISVDHSTWVSKRADLQRSLDSAVLAATSSFVRDDKSDGDLTSLARGVIRAHGFSDAAVDSVTLDVDRTDMRIDATAIAVGRSFVSTILGRSDLEMTVASAAQATGRDGNSLCVLSLNPSEDHALTLSGSGQIAATDCDVRVDSSDEGATSVTGSGMVNAANIYLTGGVQNGLNLLSPAPVLGEPAFGDPFANHPLPAIGGCDQTDYSMSGSSEVLSPGVYCGGLRLSGGAVATFLPGDYIMLDGALKLSGGSRIEGDGVAIRLAGSDASVVSSSDSEMRLIAPTTGDFAGFVFFQQHDANPGGKSVVSGGGELYFEGILYFPTQEFELSGSSSNISPSPYSIVVADKLEYSGSTTLMMEADSGATDVAVWDDKLHKPSGVALVQ